ncbi:glycosyl transferase family protein [Allosphingosinicella sp.]|uniref:glycosyl transferase family protein n=1 Tax=Allosphingosinicella sp. TaxID=2823234 RepID=UPI00378463FF
MGGFDSILSACAAVLRETALFAAFGFLLLGLSDLLVDLIWLGLRLTRRRGRQTFPTAAQPGRLAIFVPAWDEAAVIGRMLGHAQAMFGEADYRLYVGCYPNDPATIVAVRAAAGPRVRLVLGPAPGPTSKADCLNRLWERMLEDEAADAVPVKAVVLHDAEDVVHSSELALFDALVETHDLIQLPVLPLVDPHSHFVAGHYLDEFTEAHGKELVVRTAIGASLPSAGVGCAIARDALAALADVRGAPFDPDSLTEDYELGLRLHMLGRKGAFVRLPAGPGRPVIATREYFPATLDAAVAQKARWMTGIALAGWDRLGWSGGLAERWMRLRDRQSLLAALVLVVAYVSLAVYVLLLLADRLTAWTLPPFGAGLAALLAVNSALFLWRLAMRFGFVARAYGWREGLRSLPRTVTANIIAMMAARRALARYLAGRSQWDKTGHHFPDKLPAE